MSPHVRRFALAGFLAVAGLASLSVSPLAIPASAEDAALSATIAPRAAERYDTQEAQLTRLRADPAPEARYRLAQMLERGIQINATNPLLKKSTGEAEAILRDLVGSADGDVQRRARSLLSRLLQRSEDRAKREEADRLRQSDEPGDKLLSDFAADPSKAVALPAGADLATVKTRLAEALDDGNANAAFLLAELAATDPAASESYRTRGILQLATGAENSISDAIALAERYLSGDGVPLDRARAVELLQRAVRLGSNRALQRLDELARATEPATNAASVRSSVVEGLSLGLVQAAELVADDLVNAPFYGFTKDDSLYAISLLSEIEDRRALLMAAKIYTRGLNGPVDVEAARPFLAALAAVDGLSPERQMRVGREIAELPLPGATKRQYALPVFLASARGGSAEGAVQLAKLVAADPAALDTETTPVSTADVLTLLEKAGEGNHRPALVLLGDLYGDGAIVPADPERAADFYRRALAISADDDVKERLARALRDGKDRKASLADYWKLLDELSSRGGSPWSAKEYGAALLKGDRELVADPARGAALLRDAYGRGYLQAGAPLAKYLARSKDPAAIAEAAGLFERIWNETHSPSAGVNLTELYVQSGRLAEADGVAANAVLARDHQALHLRAQIALREPVPRPADAFRYLKDAIAIAGDASPRALTYAKLMFSLDVPGAEERAVAVLVRFADKGDPKALSELIPYYLGRVDADPAVLSKLAEWTRVQARTGRTEDVVKFTRRLVREGVPADRQRFGVALLEEVHAMVPADASVSLLLANAYRLGLGVPADGERAKQFLEVAARTGARDAQVEMAEAYLYGIGYERDRAAATRLLERAAAQDSDGARLELGRILSASEGAEFSPQKAFSYFSRAANNGSPRAMLAVGMAYLGGAGTTQNEALGLRWMQKAVDARLPDAMYQLYFYYVQKPGPENAAKALAYLKQAADANILTAKLRYAIHLRELDPEKNHDEIVATLKQAVAAGHNSSRRYLLEHYRNEM